MTTDPTISHAPSPNEFVALVVDNNSASRLILRGLLESQGGHVIHAENVSDAEAVFGVCAPDIVLLSVTPETGGFEACAQIRALPKNINTPVLTILELDDEATISRALAAGAADYVTKPIHPAVLRHRMRRLLQAHNIDTAVIRAKREWEVAFDAVADMIILTDLHGKIIRCNLATIQHLETTYSELIGCDLKSVLLQGAAQELSLPFRESHEMQFPALPGWFEVRTFPGHLEGRWHTIVYIIKDITARKLLEESVRESEQRFQALVENMSEGIMLCDAEGKILYLSPAVTSLTGYEQEVLGESAFLFIHPDELPTANQVLFQLLKYPQENVTGEIRAQHKDGSWIWIEFSARNLLNEAGIEAILLNFKDLTRRKQMELKLCQLSQAVEQSPVSIVITNTTGTIEYVNSRFTELTGYTLEESIGQNPRFLKSGQTPPETYVHLWDAILVKREWHGEFINKKKNGEIFVERGSISPVIDEHGQITHFLALKEDITEHKRAQAALAESEERLRIIVETIPTPLLISAVDDGTILFANEPLGELLGLPMDQLIGQKTPDFYFNTGDRKILLERLKKEGRLRNYELATKRANDMPFWVLASGQFVTFGGQSSLLAAFYDVTERRQAEERLSASEVRYRSLFEDSPVALWEEDFSEVKAFLDCLRTEENVTDVRAYFEMHPEAVAECANKVVVKDINKAAMKLLGAEKKEQLLGSLNVIVSPDLYGTFREELINIANGCTQYTFEGPNRTLSGDIKHVRVLWSVWPGYEDTLSNVMVSVIDLTERKQAEEALRLSEERFQMVTHATNDAVWDLNLSTNEIWWNRGMSFLFGYTGDQIGKRDDWWEERIHPDDHSKVLASFRNALTSDGQFWSKEYRFRRANGTYAYVFDRAYIISDEQGTPVRAIGALMDISDRKQSEEALRAREQQLEEALRIARLAYWEYDVTTDLFRFNDNFYSILHTTADQAGGYTLSPTHYAHRFCHPEDQAVVHDEIKKALNSTEPHYHNQLDHRILYADGGIGFVSVRINADRDEQGQLLRLYGANQDITERKHMEAALRESEELFSKAFHVSPAPMGITRLEDGMIIDVNDSWARLLGYSRQEVVGQLMLDLPIYANPEDRRIVVQQIREQGKILGCEIKFKTASEEELILLMSAQRVEIQGQDCLLDTFYDITELRRMHETMLASQKLADLGTLAAGVAHEMNSPLQVITGVSQSLLRKTENGVVEPEQLKRNLDVIHRNGWRCAEIVRSLHTYARNPGGSMDSTGLNDLVTDALLLIEHQLKSWANISVRTVLAENLPAFTCDRNQITQVLINLLTNARDAMPDGGEIMIATGHDHKMDQLLLQISDTGIGIPDSIRSKIFDPFFTTKPLGKGTGLGLSIVDGIVRAHGGTIEVNPALPQGTTFTARFPAKPLKLPASEPGNVPGRFHDIAHATVEQTI